MERIKKCLDWVEEKKRSVAKMQLELDEMLKLTEETQKETARLVEALQTHKEGATETYEVLKFQVEELLRRLDTLTQKLRKETNFSV